jgi:hypothetical protein
MRVGVILPNGKWQMKQLVLMLEMRSGSVMLGFYIQKYAVLLKT